MDLDRRTLLGLLAAFVAVPPKVAAMSIRPGDLVYAPGPVQFLGILGVDPMECQVGDLIIAAGLNPETWPPGYTMVDESSAAIGYKFLESKRDVMVRHTVVTAVFRNVGAIEPPTP